ncbi:jg12869 [Pararge aegeria aegeria]|uniref:Jg12869 protein n=1 Tax=Pararge aegeria aegeria TaxID=348720 RepID=A0A8S4S579_9NEOP|nr:jg12869 [Pararge aegeria aegeria]
MLPMTYGSETWSQTTGLIRRLGGTQRTLERAMLGVSLRDQIRNGEIRRRTGLNIAQRVAKLKCQSSADQWTFGSQGGTTADRKTLRWSRWEPLDRSGSGP